jgi:hypothetical protein
MVTITYKGNLEKIKTAVACANSLLKDPKFYQNIREHNAFDMADVSPLRVAELIREAEIPMRIVMYIASPRVHGYDDIFNPDLIHINVFRSDWTISGIVNTIIHQVVHAVNDAFPQYSFGHGDRNSPGKENTAPYWIASCAEGMLTERPGKTGLVHEVHPESLALDTMD